MSKGEQGFGQQPVKDLIIMPFVLPAHTESLAFDPDLSYYYMEVL